VTARSLLRILIPEEFQPPTHLPRRILASIGYYRFRSWLASRGGSVPNAGLYQPLFSPWEGLADFESQYRVVRKNTLVSRDRCYMLWCTLRQALHLPGDFVECGVFRGGTALLAARTIREIDAPNTRQFHLFDSFSGMPDKTDREETFGRGDFRRTSPAHVQSLLADYPFVKLHVGFIPDTFNGLSLPTICWAHIDLDLYQSVHDAIEYFYPRLAPGGYMIFDDYGFPSCPGARRAVDEAFSRKPEVPLCLPTGQCLVVKLAQQVAVSA